MSTHIDRLNKKFLNPLVSVDVVMFTIHEGRLLTLLVNRKKEPYRGLWALPGGFPLRKERAKDTAIRILREKVGLHDPVYMEQLYTFDTPHRDPRDIVFSVTYMGLIPYEVFQRIQSSSTTERPTFHSVDKLPKLAFDHRDIVSYAIERLQGKLAYTNIAHGVLPDLFTFAMLQSVYEIILEKKIDKRNFRKKIEQLGFLKATKNKLTGKKQRPAVLFQFKSKNLTESRQFI